MRRTGLVRDPPGSSQLSICCLRWEEGSEAVKACSNNFGADFDYALQGASVQQVEGVKPTVEGKYSDTLKIGVVEHGEDFHADLEGVGIS